MATGAGLRVIAREVAPQVRAAWRQGVAARAWAAAGHGAGAARPARGLRRAVALAAAGLGAAAGWTILLLLTAPQAAAAGAFAPPVR